MSGHHSKKPVITFVLLVCLAICLFLNMATFAWSATPYLVQDINPGAGSSSPAYLSDINGQLYFRANDGQSGYEPWSSDGTIDGTQQIADINLGSGHSFPQAFTVLGDSVIFCSNDGVHGYELWKTDGYSTGTSLVVDLNPGAASGNPKELAEMNGQLFFSGDNGVIGNELFISDGTALGTSFVYNFNGMTTGSFPRDFIPLNGAMIIAADGGNGKWEVYRSDGTFDGTRLVRNINPLVDQGSNPQEFTRIGNFIYFAATSQVEGRELWKTDGTQAGTFLVKDIVSNMGSSDPHALVANGANLYFFTSSGLWQTDGTESGTVSIAYLPNIYPANNPIVINGILFFSYGNLATGIELWKSDGTQAGTVLVKDINPGSGHSYPQSFTNFDGKLYFFASDGVTGTELWESDGTAAGTRQVVDLNPGSADGVGSGAGAGTDHIKVVGDKLFFAGNDGQNGSELWAITVDPVYTITPNAVGYGNISPNLPQRVDPGEMTSFSVLPDPGYQIDNVSGCEGSLVGNLFTTAPATQDCTVTATFRQITHNLGVMVTGQGTVHSTPGADMQCTGGCAQGYVQDTIVTLTTNPYTHYNFTGWTGDCTGTGDCTLTMDAAKSVTANFSANSSSYPFILLSTQSGYPSIQQAYNNIGSSDVLKVKASYAIIEALVLDRNVTIRIEGGYDDTFAGIVSATTLNGRLRISAGQLIVSNLIIK